MNVFEGFTGRLQWSADNRSSGRRTSFDKVDTSTLTLHSASRTPPVVRAPNGILKDVVQYLGKGIMRASVSSQPFRDLAAALRDGGFTTHGSRLESILNGTWTTSSELIGELGVAVMAIRKECEPLTSSQKTLIKECLRQVRRAWPGFGWFGWLR